MPLIKYSLSNFAKTIIYLCGDKIHPHASLYKTPPTKSALKFNSIINTGMLIYDFALTAKYKPILYLVLPEQSLSCERIYLQYISIVI